MTQSVSSGVKSVEVVITDVVSVISTESGSFHNAHSNNDVIRISLHVCVKKDIKGVDVQFDFDLTKDNTEEIASEMKECEGLAIIDIETNSIIEAIGPIIDSAKKHLHQIDYTNMNRLTVAELAILDIMLSSDYCTKPCFRALKTKVDLINRNLNKRELYYSLSNPTVDETYQAQSQPFPYHSSHSTIYIKNAVKSQSNSVTMGDEKQEGSLSTTDMTSSFDDEEYNQEYEKLLNKYNEAIIK